MSELPTCLSYIVALYGTLRALNSESIRLKSIVTHYPTGRSIGGLTSNYPRPAMHDL